MKPFLKCDTAFAEAEAFLKDEKDSGQRVDEG